MKSNVGPVRIRECQSSPTLRQVVVKPPGVAQDDDLEILRNEVLVARGINDEVAFAVIHIAFASCTVALCFGS